MPVLGTLTTMLNADATGFTAGMTEATKTAQKFERETTSSLRTIEERLGGMRSSLASFREITELAFGFHVGRMFFEQIHEGLVHAAEGFKEARDHGLSFGDSIATAAAHALHLKSALDDVLAAEKQNIEAAKEHAAAMERGNAFARERAALADKAFGGTNRNIEVGTGANRHFITPDSHNQDILRQYDAKLKSVSEGIQDASGKIKLDEGIMSKAHGEEFDKANKDYLAQLTKRSELQSQRSKLSQDLFWVEMRIQQETIQQEKAAKNLTEFKQESERAAREQSEMDAWADKRNDELKQSRQANEADIAAETAEKIMGMRRDAAGAGQGDAKPEKQIHAQFASFDQFQRQLQEAIFAKDNQNGANAPPTKKQAQEQLDTQKKQLESQLKIEQKMSTVEKLFIFTNGA